MTRNKHSSILGGWTEKHLAAWASWAFSDLGLKLLRNSTLGLAALAKLLRIS